MHPKSELGRRVHVGFALMAAIVVAMFPKPASADGKPDRSGAKKTQDKKVEPQTKTPREPEWLSVHNLLADSLVVEFAVTGEQPGQRAKIRRQHVVCLRAIYPRQEQVEKIVAALPTIAEAARQPLTEPGPRAPKVDDLLQLVKFKVERQEAAGKPGTWEKVTWQELPEGSVTAISAAEDFDEEIVLPAEYSPELTSPLPKLDKGKWDERVLHPRLKENKLAGRKPAATKKKTLQESGDEWGTARFLLFRFFDLEAKYGRSYRYRIKIISRNPAFDEIDVPPEVAEGENRESPWSEPSPAVTVGTSSK